MPSLFGSRLFFSQLRDEGLTKANYKEFLCLEIYAEEVENSVQMRDYDMHHVWLKPVFLGQGCDFVVRHK